MPIAAAFPYLAVTLKMLWLSGKVCWWGRGPGVTDPCPLPQPLHTGGGMGVMGGGRGNCVPPAIPPETPLFALWVGRGPMRNCSILALGEKGERE